MEKLPQEVLHCIFIQLSLGDKIKCTLVCKNWWRVLNDFSLVHSIEIVQQFNRFRKFNAMIERLPHRAAHVHELSLINVYLTSFNKRILVDMFPNARVLKNRWDFMPNTSVETSLYVSEPIQVSHSNSKLRVLHDSAHCEMASQIFTSNLGGKLEELKLKLGDPTNGVFHTFINQLNNLPFLKKLYLEDAAFEIRDLERIHENAPAIQELTLSWLDLSKSEIPSHTVPAPSVTTVELRINRADLNETLDRFHRYMTMKYPSAAKSQHEVLRFGLYPSENRSYIHSNVLLDIHGRYLTSKITVFKMKNIADGTNLFEVFEVLDGSGCKLEVVRCTNHDESEAFFHYLPQSDQPNFIHTINLVDVQIALPSILKSMRHLTILELTYTDKMVDISLTEHLNACPPSLKCLFIACTRILVDASNTQTSSIRDLEIKCSKFISGLDKVITSCLPDLKQLTMTGEIPHVMNITLSPWLQCACFHPTNSAPVNFVFTPLDTDIPERYIYNTNCQIYNKKNTLNLRTLNVASPTQMEVTVRKEIRIDSLFYRR